MDGGVSSGGVSSGGVSSGGGGVVVGCVGAERWRFEVEMKPFDETMVVSWKKLMKLATNEQLSDDDSDEDVDKYMVVPRRRPNKRQRDEENGFHVNQEVQRKRRKTSVHIIDAFRLAERKLRWSILQLKKLVETSKAPLIDAQGSYASSQEIEKQMHPDLKEKLAKVARQTQLHDGHISEELIDHLMGILGKYLHRKTLKKILRNMVLEDLFAKKADCKAFKKIESDIVKMVRLKTSSSNSAVSSASEVATMDDQLEDKLYDLYDTFTQELDEDVGGSVVRRLYAKLAQLWPQGT